MNSQYQEQSDLVGVVRLYLHCNPDLYDPISEEDIEHYIELARGFRDVYKKEKAKQKGTRTESECANAVRARIQLSQSDETLFYPNRQCDYTTQERVFLLACVAVTGSRDGATTPSGIALFSRRAPKGLHDHINTYLKGTDVSYQD